MDSTALAVLVGAVVGGVGGLSVPWLIARVPPWEPPPEPEPSDADADPSGASATLIPSSAPPEPPEPYPDIARLPGLGWRSAVASAVAGAVVGGAVGWHWAWVLWVPFIPLYVALAIIDWRTRLLPTYLIRPAYGAMVVLVAGGAAVTGDTDALIRAALGWLCAGGLFALCWVIYPRGLGFGDVRLAGLLGIALGWVGWGTLLIGVYAGFLLGGVLGGLLALARIFERRSFPFGPFMLVGCVIGLLWGADLWTGLVAG
jgi:leader peptidase (prepilin peptidase)/N-methyltransferase